MSVMMRRLSLFLVMLIFVKCISSQMKQERATMNYCNPKYLTECYGITRRSRRGEPYKSNFTLTSRYTSDNNVTIRVVMFGGGTVELLKIRLCDASQLDWLSDYMKTYSNIQSDCPYQPGLYGLFNVEFPPKNMPQGIRNLLKGKFHAKFYFQVTITEEIIVETTITFHA